MNSVLQFSDQIYCLPVVHGSGDFAIQVRETMLAQKFDCVALPLPESFRTHVEAGVRHLPTVSMVVQPETAPTASTWTPEGESESENIASYVPIDPCQPAIQAIRVALQERIPRQYIDLEVEDFEITTGVLPDPYALKRVKIEQFAAAVVPESRRPERDQHRARIEWMARSLRELEKKHSAILFVCSVLDWIWIRDAYRSQEFRLAEPEAVYETEIFRVDPRTLVFVLEELPFITSLYERSRLTLDLDDNLSIDGVKELLFESRKRYVDEHGQKGRRISPLTMRSMLKYIRNLSLIERRLTPDLYTLITAAKQIGGDLFAISLAETAREYEFKESLPYGDLKMSIGRGEFPNGDIFHLKSRLAGQPVTWRTCELRNKPPEIDKQSWAMKWNPFSHCSWPPEDVAIERFRTHVKDRALAMLGNDLARVEKFTSSIKDGIDIRETLRNWHTGELYVKENPPSRGTLDCVIMLFDSPADPRDYPWRITWHAEHQDESTLSFYATPFENEFVGPGIAMSTYGGAMFLFPPRPIPDIWQDRRFDSVDTLEERLLIAACYHSNERHIALLSHSPPGIAWRRIAKRSGKRLIHLPLAGFSSETIQKLKMFHVLNGRQVRTYAEHFIRKA
ncbi:hypothetical protein AB1L42_18840 [Thalassoglobus sp. JC818]|uniref:hypothetical protein n=1 Tax=Thalassoglobus sp. JC818 TaxID=3232136 RepID=UPI003458C9F4